MRIYISGNYIILKYILPTVLVLPFTAIYMRLNTSEFIYKSPSIHSLNFPFLKGLIKGLSREIRKKFSRR